MTKMVLGNKWELDTRVKPLYTDETDVVWK